MPSLRNIFVLASTAMAQGLVTTSATTCQTVTITGELCSTSVIPACLVMSTVRPFCDCPTPGVIPTTTRNWPCGSNPDGLGCQTTYIEQLLNVRCSGTPPHQNTTITQTETRTSCPGGCPKPTCTKGGACQPEPTTHTTTTLTCKSNCPSNTGVPPPPPPTGTPKPPVTAGAAILRPFWVL